MNRREFMRIGKNAAIGAAASAVTTDLVYSLPSRGDKLDLVQERKIDPQARRVIVFEDFPWKEGKNRLLNDSLGAFFGATGGLAHEAIKPYSRRKAMVVGGAIIAGGTLFPSILNLADRDLETNMIYQKLHLLNDLKRAGYQVEYTTKLSDFQEKLEDAMENRSKDAKTMVIINAHGTRESEISQSDKGEKMPLDQLAKLLGKIPGDRMLALTSCHFKLEPLQRLQNEGHNISVFSDNGGDPKLPALANFPFWGIMRKGLREPEVNAGIMKHLARDFNLKTDSRRGVPTVFPAGEFRL
jgi:hypothetical protein